MNIDVIKQYLVSLGFDVNNAEYNKFKRTLDEASDKVKQHLTDIEKSYVKGATIVVGALTSITAATIGLLDKTAQADLGYQKFALRMYMTSGYSLCVTSFYRFT